MNQTITEQNKHLLQEHFSNLSQKEFSEFIYDNEQKPKTTMGIVHNSIDENSKKIFKQVAAEEYKNRGFEILDKFEKSRKQRNNLNEEVIENKEQITEVKIDIDTDTALLECIKQSNINDISFFAKSKMLNKISEITNLNREEIEDYLDSSKIINESEVQLENERYNKIKNALKIILPVKEPELKIDMNESQIWQEIRANEDCLLESKIKTYLSTKENEYQKKTIAHKSVAKEVFSDPLHELNKLQKTITETNKLYNKEELNYISTAMDKGLAKYKELKEQFDIKSPKDNSLLSRFIRANELYENETIKGLYRQTEIYLKELAKGTDKGVVTTSFFEHKSVIQHTDKTDKTLSWLGEYNIILKEDKDNFYFNIVTKPFVQEKLQNPEVLPKQIEEDYITDLQKAKKTLERKYQGKKFVASSDTDSTDSTVHLDTNGWRIHLYQDPKIEKSIDFNIEYYPSGYKKTDLTETETFYTTISESLRARQFEKFLLNGEHIQIPDTGIVLWYSASDKKFMIDMKPSTFNDAYDLYKKENKRHPSGLKTEIDNAQT